jgi:uncharacterized protein (DUF362 family)
MNSLVAIARAPDAAYPVRPPFHPEDVYPEFVRSRWVEKSGGDGANTAYRLVRETLRGLGFDALRFGTSEWNPLRDIIHRGSTVVIKPNFVLHERGRLRGQHCLITHASVIRAIIDYVLLAGDGECTVIVADAPLQQADFHAILADSGLGDVIDFYRNRAGVTVAPLDLRRTRVTVDDRRIITESFVLPGDPRGYSAVALDASSQLEPITNDTTSFAVTDYDRSEMNRHHARGRHEYLISRTVLEADTFINVPKLKTHQKVGVTLALKNLVGINGSKDWLPHYRPGPPEQGGDEYPERNLLTSAHSNLRSALQGRSPRLMRVAQFVWGTYKTAFEGRGVGLSATDRKLGGRTVSGAWHGNDTTWRMVLDLNQAIFHATAEGTLGDAQPRNYLAIVDGIVGGDGDGPLSPEPVCSGLVAASQDPVALDRVCARIMGFDPNTIPMLREALGSLRYPLSELEPSTEPTVRVYPAHEDWRRWHLGFRAAPGWRGHIERPQDAEEPIPQAVS